MRESARWRSVFFSHHLALSPSRSSQQLTGWFFFAPPAVASYRTRQAPFSPSRFHLAQCICLRLPWRAAIRPVQCPACPQLASPPRFATALRAGGPLRPPHLIVISSLHHVLVVLTYIHSGPYLPRPVLFFQICLPKSSKGIEPT